MTESLFSALIAALNEVASPENLATRASSFDAVAFDGTALATRGERLALRCARRAAAEFLALVEVGNDGELVQLVEFDHARVDAAFDELDARYVAHGGADYSRFRKLRTARDWPALLAMFRSDAMVHDHRRGGWGSVTAERDVEILSQTDNFAEDSRVFIVREIARADQIVFLEQAHIGRNLEGGDFALPHYTVTVSRGSRILRADMFDLEEYETARACFDAALAAQTATE